MNNGDLRKRRGSFENPRDLMKELKNLAWKHAGPVREERSLKEGLERLSSYAKRIEQIYPASLGDLFMKKDLENIALLLEAIFQGSLTRTESRGSFCRKDAPTQDDSNWRKNTCYQLVKGELALTDYSVESGTR